jgi:hypothetical protein
MTCPVTARWWVILPIYLFAALGLGVADQPLGQAAQELGFRPGLVTAAAVNLLLPLLAIVLGAASRRLAIAWFGALVMTGGFLLGLALVHPQPQPWDAATLFRAVRPVLVLACTGYAILGSLAVLVSRRVRSQSSD